MNYRLIRWTVAPSVRDRLGGAEHPEVQAYEVGERARYTLVILNRAGGWPAIVQVSERNSAETLDAGLDLLVRTRGLYPGWRIVLVDRVTQVVYDQA